MRILVTGGAGFIGSHLCDALVEAGHDVTALDNFITGNPDNIAHLKSEPNFHFMEQDVSKLFASAGSWEAIFHLASPASPVGYGKYPLETMMVNSMGTHNMLNIACAYGASFLFASTSEVYGDPDLEHHPQSEDYWGNVNPIGVRSCYDESKRFGEALTFSYMLLHDVDARIIRIFNTYGPRYDSEDGRIIPNFITQALRGDPITVYGDGLQTRSFCYVSDLVDGIIKAMFAEGTKGEVINLGNPDERTVLGVAEIIRKLTGSKSPIVYMLARDEEIARRQPDVRKAKRILNWQPQTSLEAGLAETVGWFKVKIQASK